jgi:adenylate cyclase
MVGISRPIAVHELIGPKEEISDAQNTACELFKKGLSGFQERRWEEAEKIFAEVLKLNGSDGPASYYSGLCRTYKLNPPSEDWDGSVTMSVK